MKTIRETLLAHVTRYQGDRSINQLARDLGVDVASLHRWMTGERSIGIDVAERLALHFKLELRARKPR